MKIRTRLQINTWITLGMVALMALVAAWSVHTMGKAGHRVILTHDLGELAFNRTVQRDNYLLATGKRNPQPWREASEAFRRLLAQAEVQFKDSPNRTTLQEIRDHFHATVDLFSQVLGSHGLSESRAGRRLDFDDRERHLIGQVIRHAEALNGAVGRLHKAARQAEAATRNRAILFLFLFICGGGLVVAVNTVSANKTISRRLTDLREGIGTIGEGRLDWRIPIGGDDELADLARRGNDMAERLQASFTSLENLQREMAERRRVEEDLRDEYAFKNLLLQTSPAFIVAIGKDGKTLLMNGAMRAFLGYTEDEAIGIDYLNAFVPEEDRAALGAVFTEILQQGHATVNENRLQARDGRMHLIEWHGQPVFLPDGSVGFLVGVGIDVTERRQAEEALKRSEAFTREILDHLPIGIAVHSVDPGVVFEYMNDLFPAIYQTTREDLAHPDSFWEATFEDPVFREDVRKRVLDDCASQDPERMVWTNVPITRGGVVAAVVNARNIPISDRNLMVSAVWDVTEQYRAQEALRQSEEKYRLLVENAGEAIYVIQDGAVVFSNPRNLEIVGYSLKELSNRHFAEFIHPDDRAMVIERHRLRMEGGSVPPYYTFRLLHRSGQMRWVDLSAVRIEWNGQPATLNFMSDITPLKLAEEALRASEEKYRLVFEKAPLGLLHYDSEGVVSACNDAFVAIMGSSREALIGLPMLRLPDKRVVEAIRSTLSGNIGYFDGLYESTTADKRTWVLAQFTPVLTEDGRFLGGMGLIEDVTERRQAEEEIHQLNARLEERVRERTAQLEAANKELEAFSYSVSHDLRAPLRSIDGFSRAFQEDFGDRLDETARSYLERIRNATKRMGHLIDDLLKLARLTRKDMRRERVDLTSLARQVMEALHEFEPGRDVETVLQEGIWVEGDPDLLQVLLENLLGNAWKFTAKQAHPRIVLGLVEGGIPKTCFVRDNGVGFDMAYVKRLFGPFQRLHTQEEFPGTGIGLATVQRILSRHGGRIWAEGEPGVGATFYFTWP